MTTNPTDLPAAAAADADDFDITGAAQDTQVLDLLVDVAQLTFDAARVDDPDDPAREWWWMQCDVPLDPETDQQVTRALELGLLELGDRDPVEQDVRPIRLAVRGQMVLMAGLLAHRPEGAMPLVRVTTEELLCFLDGVCTARGWDWDLKSATGTEVVWSANLKVCEYPNFYGRPDHSHLWEAFGNDHDDVAQQVVHAALQWVFASRAVPEKPAPCGQTSPYGHHPHAYDGTDGQGLPAPRRCPGSPAAEAPGVDTVAEVC